MLATEGIPYCTVDGNWAATVGKYNDRCSTTGADIENTWSSASTVHSSVEVRFLLLATLS
jgi:hypothetical protein